MGSLLRFLQRNSTKTKLAIISGSIIAVVALGSNLANIYDSVYKKSEITKYHKNAKIIISSLESRTSVLDITLTNPSNYPVILHEATLIIKNVSNYEYFPPKTGGYLPSSYQYDMLIRHDQKEKSINLSQLIEAKKVDRFYIVIMTGILEEKGDLEGYLMPDSKLGVYKKSLEKEDLWIAGFDVQAKIRLRYNDNKTIESDSFRTTLYSPWPGSIPVSGKVAPVFSFEERKKLLKSSDCSIASSSVNVFRVIGGDRSLKALNSIKKHYENSHFKTDCVIGEDSLEYSINEAIEHIQKQLKNKSPNDS